MKTELENMEIQKLESKEELSCLIEGDFVESSEGMMVYTEKMGEPRLIMQYNVHQILSVRTQKEDKYAQVEVENGKAIIKRGNLVDIYSNNHHTGWIQYDLDQHIIDEHAKAAGVDYKVFKCPKFNKTPESSQNGLESTL